MKLPKTKYPAVTILIAATAVVMFWRGVWGLLDEYLFPENQTISFLVSIIIGVALMLVNDFKLDELQ